MKREDAQTGEERTNATKAPIGENAQFGEETRNRGTARGTSSREGERRAVAGGRFRVVSASDGAFSVGVGNAPERDRRRFGAADDSESQKSASKNALIPSKEAAEPIKSAANSANPVNSEDWAEAADGGDPSENAESFDGEFDDENAFFASFSNGSESRRTPDSFDAAFAGGLRSIFDAESENGGNGEDAEDGDASDAERFQRDLERERRESLDGVLLQNDADFLREAGEKYERPRVSDADFDRKSASRSDVGGGASNGRENENRKDGENSESVEAGARRRVPIGPASILEAMLFVGDRENRPLTLARATELMRNVSETEAIEALADLNERYWRDGAPYRIVRDGDGYRMALRPEFDALAVRMVGGKAKEFKLTQTMIDVLALIAYRQPISLDEILETRNNATGALAQLVKRELVAQEKRVVDKKKVAFYSTTSRFLRLFNLESLDDLPIVGDVDYR